MKMVVQKNWSNVEGSHQNSASEDSPSSSSWTFQAPSKTVIARPSSSCIVQVVSVMLVSHYVVFHWNGIL